MARQNSELFLTRLLNDLGYPDVIFEYPDRPKATPTPQLDVTPENKGLPTRCAFTRICVLGEEIQDERGKAKCSGLPRILSHKNDIWSGLTNGRRFVTAWNCLTTQ